MSVIPINGAIAQDAEARLEDATRRLDAALADLCKILGPNATAARVGGRLARAAQLFLKGEL